MPFVTVGLWKCMNKMKISVGDGAFEDLSYVFEVVVGKAHVYYAFLQFASFVDAVH
jgi:hypothetical protein